MYKNPNKRIEKNLLNKRPHGTFIRIFNLVDEIWLDNKYE